MDSRVRFDNENMKQLRIITNKSYTILYAGKRTHEILNGAATLFDLFSLKDVERLKKAMEKNRASTFYDMAPINILKGAPVTLSPYESEEGSFILTIGEDIQNPDYDRDIFSPDNIAKKGIEFLSKSVRDKASTILGCTNILSRQLFGDDNAMRYLQTISTCCQELVRRSSNLIEYIEETCSEKLVIYNYELVGFMKDFYSSLEKLLGESGIKLSCELPDTNYVTAFDKACIERVLVALIIKTVKNIGSGTHIKISLNDLGDWLEVCLSHNGPAISKKKVLNFFEPFSDSRNKNTDTELSLCICRSIIIRHSGSIYIKSNTTGNFTIAFTLPKRSAEIGHILSLGKNANSLDKMLKKEFNRLSSGKRSLPHSTLARKIRAGIYR